jgi:hypothetical protein
MRVLSLQSAPFGSYMCGLTSFFQSKIGLSSIMMFMIINILVYLLRKFTFVIYDFWSVPLQHD